MSEASRAFCVRTVDVKPKDNYPLPFLPDQQQWELLRSMQDNGCVIASEGTDRFEVLEHLVDQGLSVDRFCPKACNVHQFEITVEGRFLLLGASLA